MFADEWKYETRGLKRYIEERKYSIIQIKVQGMSLISFYRSNGTRLEQQRLVS